MRRFEVSQVVPLDREQAWAFFSDPRNLARITPPSMRFRITGEVPDQIYPGLIVRYRVRPLLGIPVTWVTEITHVGTGEYFVDEQRIGPYRLWHHEHHFEPRPGGTLVRDVVHYALPLGPLGVLIDRLVVASRVRGIFAYRRAVLERLFDDRARPAREASPSTARSTATLPT